jgi:hypothetical protein
MALHVGTRLANYETVEPIGARAMGEVYRAQAGQMAIGAPSPY